MKKWLACFMSVVMLFASFPSLSFSTVLAEEQEVLANDEVTEPVYLDDEESQEMEVTPKSSINSETEYEKTPRSDENQNNDGAAADVQAANAEISTGKVGNIEVEVYYGHPKESLSDEAILNVSGDQLNFDIKLKDLTTEKEKKVINGISVLYTTMVFDKSVGDEKNNTTMQPYNPENGKIFYSSINLYNLPTGNYELSLKDKASIEIKTKVELEGWSKRVEFQQKDLAVGDVDKNGVVDQLDYQAVVNEINTDKLEYDLNGDEKVDVADLVIIQENMGKTPNLEAISITDTSEIIDPNSVKLSADSSVKVTEGLIAEMIDPSSDKSVKFTKADEKPISEEEPLEIPLDLTAASIMAKQIRIVPNALTTENAPKKGVVRVEYEDGTTQDVAFGEDEAPSVRYLTDNPSSATIVVNLEGQTAIKKITIRVNATNKDSSNLVEIGKVEFLNNTKDKITEQTTSIPRNVKAEAGNEKVTVSWEAQTNVTGYEVRMSFVNPKSGKTETEIKSIDGTSLSFNDLDNFVEYTFAVQSVNGSEWKSGYSESVKATPVPSSVPQAPAGITTQGGYRQIKISWEKEKNSTGYVIYYRKAGEQEYQKKEDITGTGSTVQELEDQQEYEICVSGVNAIGEGPKSSVYRCKTTSIEPPITSNYKLINTSNGVNIPTNHIEDVEYPSNAAKDKFDIVDDDYTSYWNINSWDAGGYNTGKPSPIVVFDQAYELNEMLLVRGEEEPSELSYIKIRYWDEDNKVHLINNGIRFEKKKSTNGKEYYRIRLDEKIKAKKVQINTALYWASAPNAHVRIQELKFYYYDSLPEETEALFADDLHIELKADVTMQKIDDLIKRANTADEVSGEYHPDRDSILNELKLAESILSETNIDDSITVDQSVFNAKDSNLKFAFSMNDFQPLGAVAKAGDTITVYVGSDTNTTPQLVYTQFHAYASAWSKTINLKKGKNEITLEQIGGEDSERGGSLYIRYPYANASNGTIKVRVAGATKIPYLNLTDVKDENESQKRIEQYVKELKEYTSELPNKYTGDSTYAWDPQSSVYNCTEIMTDQMLLSVPATAVLAALPGSESDQVQKLHQNSKAMEQIMDIVYTSKGLSKTTTSKDDKNHWPFSRINIRYSRMSGGAFMYAGGMHVGIEYGSVGGVISGKPHTKQANGTMSGGALYGWGIAHEIGHVTDENDMIYGETSNNIVSQLVKTFDEEEPARADYKAIYQKVTSGTTGLADSVFTQLGMFWQLHLAYDDQYNNIDNTDSFYGRMYQNYRKNSGQQDKPDKNNLLIRMASDTAGKDLTEYFEKWGLTASEATKNYLKEKGYEKEERAIYYLNDDARHKRIKNDPGEMASDTKVTATLTHNTENGKDEKAIQFDLSVNQDQNKILGYEIIRNGEVVGFTTDNSYTDTISSMNNRVLKYEIVAYDNYLNKTEAQKLEAIKIQHDGSVSKTKWTLDSSMTSDGDTLLDECESSGVQHPALSTLYDEDYTNIYQGTKTSNNPEITINLHENMPVVGIKYTAATGDEGLIKNAIDRYTIQVSEDGKTWTPAASGRFGVSAENPAATVYFSEKGQDGSNQMVTYRAAYVRIIANGAAGVSAAEFDIIGPPGDNVDLDQSGIGILDEDFIYAPDQEPIKAGSLVFTGNYRGHPGYNAVLVKDQDGNNVVGKIDDTHPEGEAASIFMAKIPENGNIGEISEGTWIYWVDKDDIDMKNLPESVKVQLYRVDDKDTLKGQRLTSDTLDVALPANLPKIHLTNAVIPEE